MVIFSSSLQRFHRQLAGEALSNLAGILGTLIPKQQLDQLRQSGLRKRVFPPLVTFWNFLSQVLSPGQPCREAVRQTQAARKRRRARAISSTTSAYCQARRRLMEGTLQTIWQAIAEQFSKVCSPQMLWKGLRVAVVDGTTLSMPDTAANQSVWPQHSGQKPGCGFPIMKLLALFSLATGAAHALVTGTLHDAEQSLFPSLWSTLTREFDLLLGDRAFGSFAMFGALRQCGLHGVFRLHQKRKVNWRKGKRLGKYDRVVNWNKPPKLVWWSPGSAPDSITVRILRSAFPLQVFERECSLLPPICSILNSFLLQISRNSVVADGMSNCSFATSKPRCLWRSCVAEAQQWFVANCVCIGSLIISSARLCCRRLSLTPPHSAV
jgi:hypothetical protein